MKQTRWSDTITNFLDRLPHTGGAGFEGLVTQLCEAATGQRFRLSGSGQQEGQDSRSEPGTGNRIKVETKHYGNSSLNLRELIAEITQATTPEDSVDLWVLGASCAVLDQHALKLEEIASEKGVEVLFLDKGTDGFERLWALMAAYPETVSSWTSQHHEEIDISQVFAALQHVKDDPRFESVKNVLLRKLCGTALGYDDARRRANSRLREVVADHGRSKAVFNQNLAVCAQNVRRVRRTKISQELDLWWNSSNAPERRAVALGEEGTGKTWAAMSWISERLDESQMPLVLPFSAAVESITPTDTVESLLPRLLKTWTKIKTEAFWAARLARWINETDVVGPLILLVVDGLNERSNLKWPTFFRSLWDSKWSEKIAVLATDRPGHWRPYCALAGIAQFQEINVIGYTDEELIEALKGSDISVNDIPTDLQQLIRKPRYCELVVQHFAEMKANADFTVERLIYLDIKHRCATRPGYPLTGDQLTALIWDLARRYRESPTFELNEIAKLIPHPDPERSIYGEIMSGGLFERSEGTSPRYRVERVRLVFGLGMLLAEEVRQHSDGNADSTQIQETIQQWFEPHPEMDLKVQIAGSGLFHALLDSSFPTAGRRELICYWLGLRNWDDHAQEAFTDYVARCPKDFIAVTEGFWSSNTDRGAAQEFLAHAFLKHRDDQRVQPVLVDAVNRWMGFIHPDGPPLMGGDDERRQRLREEIAQRVGHPLEPGQIDVAGERLTVIEDPAYLRLSRFGLLIMSGGSRDPFIRSLVLWAIASAVHGRGLEADVADWVTRLSDDNIEPILLSEARRLIDLNNPLALKAAHTLLWRIGTPAAKRLREDNPAPEPEYLVRMREEHRKDPCNSLFAWTEEECARCLDREDIPAFRLIGKAGNRLLDPNYPVPPSLVQRASRGLPDPKIIHNHMFRSHEDYLLDEITPLMAAHAPTVIADLIRSCVRTMPERELLGQRILGFWLPKITFLLHEPEVHAVQEVLNQLWENARGNRTLDDEQRTVEEFGFLGVLPQLEPSVALDALLGRPLEAHDLLELEHWFEPLPPEKLAEALKQLHSISEPRTLVRLLWYISASKPTLTHRDIERIGALADNDDSGVRACAIRFACLVNDSSLGKLMVRLNRSFRDTMPWWEMYWGAQLLIQFSAELPFDEVAQRLHPSTASFLLKPRGNNPQEIQLYAKTVDRIWAQITCAEDPQDVISLPAVRSVPIDKDALGDGYPDFAKEEMDSVTFRDPSTSWTSGGPQPDMKQLLTNFGKDTTEEWNRQERERVRSIIKAWGTDAFQWYGRRFSRSALRQICQECPSFVERWIESVINNDNQAQSLHMRLGSFLSQLCPTLFEFHPALGLKLWKVLNKRHNESLFFDAADSSFAAPDNQASEEARQLVLDAAWDDASLSRIAYLAERYNRQAWLRKIVENLFQGPQLWKKAKGLTLASCSSLTTETFEHYVATAEITGTWVEDQLSYLRDNVRMNTFAQHWYRRFIKVEDWDTAWGAFELFLKCADQRFYLWWRDHENNSACYLDRKLRFVEASEQHIKNELKRDKKRQDTLFGIKIERGEVFPFLRV